MKKPEEKRLFPRKVLKTNVVFEDEFGEGLFFVKSKDISLGGVFLDSAIPMKMGTMLFLSLILPSCKNPIKLTGEVVRAGLGIRFVGLTDDARRRIETFLSTK